MFGYHVAKGDGFAKSIPAAVGLINGCGIPRPCVQIFAVGPQSSRVLIAPSEYHVIKAAIGNAPTVIHGAYLDNPWGEWRKHGKGISTGNIIREMEISHAIGARGVVVHLAAGAAEEESIDHVLQTVDSGLEDEILRDQILFLEINTAKASPNTFETPKKIAALFQRISSASESFMLKIRVGLCIDSAHVFSCGVSFAAYEPTRDWLTRTVAALPAGTPIMFHLNDSASTLGSGVDKHEELCRGNIWENYREMLPVRQSGLAAIIEWVVENDIMCIREHKTHFPEADLKLIKELIGE